MNQTSLRDQNLRMVARMLWHAGGGLTRAELAARTGLTRATVSRLVSELLDAELVVERGPTDSGQPGRPGTPLSPAAGTVAALGLDVNIDHLGARIIDLTGVVLGEFIIWEDLLDSEPTAPLARLGKQAAAMVKRVLAEHPGLRLCPQASLALPGMISDYDTARWLPNLGWRELRPGELLGREFARLGLGLFVDNDANLQALATSRLAPGRLVAEPTFLYIGGDVGIGSAIVEAGELRRGQHGWAGEIGHMVVDPDGPECACGLRGCLERYAGRLAVTTAAGIEGTRGEEELTQRLQRGDQTALAAIDRAAWALGLSLANALNLMDMRQVLLGTSLATVAPWILPRVQRTLTDHLLWADLDSIAVLPAHPDELPAVTGGAYLLLEQVIDDPGAWIERVSTTV